MGKIQLFLDGAAARKQPVLASRWRDDPDPEWAVHVLAGVSAR
jgi:hypothetical protein